MCNCQKSACGRKLLLIAGLSLLLAAAPASAEVYGLKSKDPQSEPPTHLFTFHENGSGITDHGPVKVGGDDTNLDGLAYSLGHGLLAFNIVGFDSQLLSISVSPPTGTPIGTPLVGREIRGAVFDFDDRLWVIDCENDELLEIDPGTGLEIGTAIPLIENGMPYDLMDIADIALRGDGTFYISSYEGSGIGQILELDRATGTVVFRHDLGSDYLAGMTFSKDALGQDHLFSYDVRSDDDLYYLEVDNDFALTMLHKDILPQFYAGGGDLAALIEPAPLVADRTFLHLQGGQVEFIFAPGPAYAGRNYMLLASLSGTDPGTPLPGGLVTLPLNRDGLTQFVLNNITGPWFTGFQGTLDAAGSATAQLDTLGSLPPSFAGATIHFAAATSYPWDFASNPIAVEVEP